MLAWLSFFSTILLYCRWDRRDDTILNLAHFVRHRGPRQDWRPGASSKIVPRKGSLNKVPPVKHGLDHSNAVVKLLGQVSSHSLSLLKAYPAFSDTLTSRMEAAECECLCEEPENRLSHVQHPIIGIIFHDYGISVLSVTQKAFCLNENSPQKVSSWAGSHIINIPCVTECRTRIANFFCGM